jgi:hypothetical protein
MELPELPKVRNKKEADFGLQFRKWMKENPQMTGAFELKQTEGSLPFSSVKDHQLAALLAAKYKGLLWKIADDSKGVKPFDYFYLREACAYVVIKFPDVVCFIDVDDFILEKAKSIRRSLTSKRAKEMAVISVEL